MWPMNWRRRGNWGKDNKTHLAAEAVLGSTSFEEHPPEADSRGASLKTKCIRFSIEFVEDERY
jgi:hypothetical protein